MEPYQLRVLGPPQVWRADHVVRGYRSLKALALLCYLAAVGRPVSRAFLTCLFWGEKAEAEGLGDLRRVLNNLNTLIPGCFTADRRCVQLAGRAVIEPDAAEFESLLAQGDVESLTTAAHLYQSEFMEGFYLDGCANFEDWLEGAREDWRQRIGRVWQRLIDYYGSRGDYETALLYATRQLALDPLEDEYQQQVMVLQASCGRYRAALAQYTGFSHRLAEKLGAPPAAGTTDLYKRLQAAAAMRRVELPDHLTP